MSFYEKSMIDREFTRGSQDYARQSAESYAAFMADVAVIRGKLHDLIKPSCDPINICLPSVVSLCNGTAEEEVIL